MSKLKLYGMRGNAFWLFKNYMSGRQQIVRYKNSLPQGQKVMKYNSSQGHN